MLECRLTTFKWFNCCMDLFRFGCLLLAYGFLWPTKTTNINLDSAITIVKASVQVVTVLSVWLLCLPSLSSSLNWHICDYLSHWVLTGQPPIAMVPTLNLPDAGWPSQKNNGGWEGGTASRANIFSSQGKICLPAKVPLSSACVMVEKLIVDLPRSLHP
jgi:hypothetical protein